MTNPFQLNMEPRHYPQRQPQFEVNNMNQPVIGGVPAPYPPPRYAPRPNVNQNVYSSAPNYAFNLNVNATNVYPQSFSNYNTLNSRRTYGPNHHRSTPTVTQPITRFESSFFPPTKSNFAVNPLIIHSQNSFQFNRSMCQDVWMPHTQSRYPQPHAPSNTIKYEANLREKHLTVVCNQKDNGWSTIINDNARRSYAGFKRNPFSASELDEWWKLFTTSAEIKWNRPIGLPRKCAWLVSSECQCCYRYSNTLWAPNAFPEWFKAITSRVLEETGLHFEFAPNSCNVNWYKDGNDSVGWHSDDEALFDSSRQDTLIISLSLGQHRRFEVKLKDDDKESDLSDEIKDIVLYSGDLMTMEGLFQKHYLHRVPKQYDIANCKARINCTWRWIKNHYKNRDQCNATQSGAGRVGQNNKNV
eukprot:1042063_1